MKIPVQSDLVPVLQQQVDLRRVLLDDPAGNKESLAQLELCKLLDQARDRDQRVVTHPLLRRDEVVGCFLVVPVKGAVGVHVPGHRHRAARAVWPWDRVCNHRLSFRK